MQGGYWIESMKKRMEEAAHCNSWRQGRATIFKVPTNLRWWNMKTYDSRVIHNGPYDPKYVSIGPYHRENSRLQKMEEFKWRMLRVLLGGDRDRMTHLEKCLEEMEKLEVRARSSYSEAIDMCSKEFVEMMLLDGCFIVFILAREIKGMRKILGDKLRNAGPEGDGGLIAPSNFLWGKLKIDILLLENQIPYFVVETLFELLVPPFINEVRTFQPDIILGNSAPNDLAVIALKGFHPGKTEVPLNLPPNHLIPCIHHLLHLFYLFIVPAGTGTDQHAGTDTVVQSELTNPPKWIPCVTELQTAGVTLKANKDKKFLDVTFCDGVLEIPVLGLYDRTEPILRNLIAFEQCFRGTEYKVTYYTFFMDCLVNAPQDVSILQKNGIIINWVNDEVEAARLFNELGIQVNCDEEKNYLSDIYGDLNEYYGKKKKKWMAMLWRNYFDNPWSITSIIGAFILLLLATTQTAFAINSYYHPRQSSNNLSQYPNRNSLEK
ncbi:UPF0481 protein [Acorus calamus]|uniref:UPF0481 protein n=1 Tax=Acorus calamus TaxID=4465 RepID=A0AAV9DL96_ACOCL|nr:UPF0481 protein [Acorus calamus]